MIQHKTQRVFEAITGLAADNIGRHKVSYRLIHYGNGTLINKDTNDIPFRKQANQSIPFGLAYVLHGESPNILFAENPGRDLH